MGQLWEARLEHLREASLESFSSSFSSLKFPLTSLANLVLALLSAPPSPVLTDVLNRNPVVFALKIMADIAVLNLDQDERVALLFAVLPAMLDRKKLVLGCVLEASG